jgi:hypothetical protein
VRRYCTQAFCNANESESKASTQLAGMTLSV